MLFSSVLGMNSPYKIAIVGLWHLGEIYSACLAELGHNVIGLTEEQAVIDNFLKNVPPLAEPKLAELISVNRGAGRLAFSSDFTRVKDRDIVWVTFDTPVNDEDEADVEVVLEA